MKNILNKKFLFFNESDLKEVYIIYAGIIIRNFF